MKIESEELKEYVREVTNAINSGVDREKFNWSDIEIEIAVITTKEADGSLKLHILNAGGKLDIQEISKIKFKIRSRSGPPAIA